MQRTLRSTRSANVEPSLEQKTRPSHSSPVVRYVKKLRTVGIVALSLSCIAGLAWVYGSKDPSTNSNWKAWKVPRGKFPIFYSSKYNMGLNGWEAYLGAAHSFDLAKYKKVFNSLTGSGLIKPDQFIEPPKASRLELLEVHSEEYLESLKNSKTVARIAEVGTLQLFPSWMLRWLLLDPMLYATGGSLYGAKAAMEKGWAINLGGGFHHASATSGGGFCFFADITMAVKRIKEFYNLERVMILDLDAHQGNGFERDFINDKEHVYIVDFYVGNNYPYDQLAKGAIRKRVELPSYTTDEKYLDLLNSTLNKAIMEFNPQFILYNAGTDILQNDPIGKLSISPQGCIARDEMVFSKAFAEKVPIMMVLSGGYQENNANVIASSLKNLHTKFGLFDQTKL